MSTTASTASRPTRRIVLGLTILALLSTTVVASGGGAATAAPTTRTAPGTPAPVSAGSRYLALGDSVPFGYREAANPPPPDYSDAANFVGYPENVGAELKLRVANASCPGETSASMIKATAPSNGCETQAGSSAPGYRSAFPLHVAYPGAQVAYGRSYLRKHPDTRLVSLMIGANDGFLCQAQTSDNCVSELPTVLAKIQTNVGRILSSLRHNAHYTGQIVLVDYYSLNYADPVQSGFSQALNGALKAAGAPYDVAVADGYGTFQRAATQYGGDSCAAGLLTRLSTGGCGVHPSVAGQELLAGAVERVTVTA